MIIGMGLVGVMPLAYTTSDVVFAGNQVPWFVPVLGLVLVTTVFAYVVGIVATRGLGLQGGILCGACLRCSSPSFGRGSCWASCPG